MKVRDNTGWFPYLVHLDYLPPNFHVTRPVLLLVTGLLSTLVNLAALVLLFKNRKSTTSSNGRKVKCLEPVSLLHPNQRFKLMPNTVPLPPTQPLNHRPRCNRPSVHPSSNNLRLARYPPLSRQERQAFRRAARKSRRRKSALGRSYAV